MGKEPNWIELDILGINYSKKNSLFNKLFKASEDYILVLQAKENKKARFNLLINQLEGQGIAIVLEKMTPRRPLIQDIFKLTVEVFDSTLEYILINEYDVEGYLWAIMNFSGVKKEIRARPADAIAVALRFECPIYIVNDIFEKLRINL